MSKLVAFGEIMARLAPPGFLRLRQALPGSLDVTFAGSEANVAVTVAQLGGESAFVTALPRNPPADACAGTLAGLGVDVSHIVRTEYGRLGLYFLETGANQRPSNVLYDREGSSVSRTPAKAYDWAAILSGASWFHVSGITPAISREAAGATLGAVQAADESGITVSCDLNFRKKLWRWEDGVSPRELAERTMRTILPFVDVVVANEEDAANVLSIVAEETDVEAGKLAADRYPAVAQEIVSQFGNVSAVAVTLRESISASHNRWGGMYYERDSGSAFFAPWGEGGYQPYEIRSIVDRVGAGDAFAGALIYALMTPDLCAPETAVAFAAAASCLAHSVSGDFNFCSRQEVLALVEGGGSGRVVR
jgi:2-dehydro-3-deoxygluconokinase